MAIKSMSNQLKNGMLDAAFTPNLTIEAYNPSNQSVSDKIAFNFGSASSGAVEITAPISIAVGKVVVNSLRIFYAAGAHFATVNLEGSEVKDFTGEESGGIYQINTLKISI